MGLPSYPNEAPPRDNDPEFANPAVRDGINTPDKKPLRGCLVNFLTVIAALLILGVLIDLAARFLTPCIPFRWERALVGETLLASVLDEGENARQDALRGLARRIAAVMELPDDMTITVFYSPESTRNAFATFGGNIVVYAGLLELMESEDELAMVLAHEIAHVKHRDLVKGVTRAIGFAILSMGMNDSGAMMEKAAGLGMAGYSRAQETDADLEAVRALGKVYGHAAGAGGFFLALAEKVEGRSAASATRSLKNLTSTHPDTLYRLERCRREAARLGLDVEAETTPLSAVFRKSGVPPEETGGEGK